MAIKQSQSGLTLVEMVVVIAIFGVVSAVLLFNFSGFNNNVSVRNLSQEIALSVRKAQMYATGVRSVDGTANLSDRYSSYGVSFSAKPSATGFNPYAKQFILFADTASSGAGNRYYDTGSGCGSPSVGNECVEAFGIQTGDSIVNVCTENGCSATQTVNVVFRRPSPDAKICIVSGSSCGSDRSFVSVVVRSTKGAERTITVWNTGQISVL